MAFRGNESPMDFQWEKHGPTDPSSPFHKFAMANDKKRSHSTFNSPVRNNTTSRAKDVPISPWRNPSFTTPRKNFDLDFSSGPESSPVMATDNDTPDGKPLPAVPRTKEKKETKSKRNTLFNFYGRFAPSSGKGEIKNKKPAVTDPVAKKAIKKRRQAQTFERQLALAKRESVEGGKSDSDPDTPQPQQKRKRNNKGLPPVPSQEKSEGLMASFFNFIHAYPDAPSIIAKYFQVMFNGAILSGCLFLFYSFYATIRSDVDKASEDAFQEALAETIACQKHYIDNRCNAASRLPALEVSCARWEICMNRDPNAVRRASLSAHTFAEIINSFVEPITLKTTLLGVLFVALLLFVNNATFSLYRRSQEHHGTEGYRAGSAQYPPHQYALTSPGGPYQTPGQWQVQGNGMQQQQQIEYDQSPSKTRTRNGSPEKKRLMLERDDS